LSDGTGTLPDGDDEENGLVGVFVDGSRIDIETPAGELYRVFGVSLNEGATPHHHLHDLGLRNRIGELEGVRTWAAVTRGGRGPFVRGERRIKRVQRLAGDAWLLISDNDHYQPEMIKSEETHDVEILGRYEIRIGKIS
jgi:hypothetical protein